MEVVAYVLSKDGNPLMPMCSNGRARRFLKTGKAIIKSRVPFVIQLTYDIPNAKIEPLTLGIDPGRTNIGLCVIDETGSDVYAAKVETRNKEIPKLMSDRKAHRNQSRRGRRKRKQRRAKANNTCFDTKERKLPQCEELITVNYINNKEARFCNRTRPEGWLTPTANHLMQTHINAVLKVMKILPIENIVIEINKFDFVRMENPNVRNWEYQKGALWGHDSVEEAVYQRQSGKCLLCNNKIEHYHHVAHKANNGNESVDNRAGLCNKCHDKVHKNREWEVKLLAKQEGVLKKYHALSVINQIMPYLLKKLSNINDNLYVTTGADTHFMRRLLNLDKDHHIDAWCIANSLIEGEVKPSRTPYYIKQYRRQNRAIIHSQRGRTYSLDGKTIAKNRKKRMDQQDDSLQEWYNKKIEELGTCEARKLLSRVKVTKSKRHYNADGRVYPGAVFTYAGKRHVLSGQLSGGQYFRAYGDAKTNYPARKCNIIQYNSGLVYM